MKKYISILLFYFVFNTLTQASQATWIWYPGDVEIWLGNQMNNRRTERGTFFPPFWKMDSHYVLVEFSKKFQLDSPEIIKLSTEGYYNVKLDGKFLMGMPQEIVLPVGEHQLNVKVWNQASPPTLFIEGKTIFTDADWQATFEDKEWIDESGRASDTSTSSYVMVGCSDFNNVQEPPSTYRLATEAQYPVNRQLTAQGELIDFGKETFGFLQLHQVSGEGVLSVYYGESETEALDTKYCETLDILQIQNDTIQDLTLNQKQPLNSIYTLPSKAFRYVYIEKSKDLSYADVDMLYEYKPVEYRGKFRCNDEEINKIWDISEYTMHLTTREFFVDGIKRDRWVWSGDAIQSYLMNYYLFFDNETVKRTIWLLRGKNPVTSHINTIMDYTFYWFLSIYDYYLYTGDAAFIRQIYPDMKSLMDFVLERTNDQGMVEGLEGDWVFVDWADGFLDKRGELSFEQVLFARSFEAMAQCASIYGDLTMSKIYEERAQELIQTIERVFWDSERQALVHNRVQGVTKLDITRYANMFAIFFDYLSEEKKQAIKTSVLLNDEILKISTPYMRFYELEALCILNEHQKVMQEIKAYWGGMLKEGATSFWEKYNPDDQGKEHLSMYGRPYGKSLCHAWGASPVYLLGRYYLGIQPLEPGYKTYTINPHLGGLKWMEGKVPTPNGDIKIRVDKRNIQVTGISGCTGTLTFRSKTKPISNHVKILKVSTDTYSLIIEEDADITVRYQEI